MKLFKIQVIPVKLLKNPGPSGYETQLYCSSCIAPPYNNNKAQAPTLKIEMMGGLINIL